ncbi:sulfate ABC transporter permease subunit CysT [Geminocystis sp. GBBB08]|uniref:sulfate ABC transporter permease subunit CysT n=1 Tax=Geminocystis sp. GBBB08 TaxID=2604140 RepID=UPI0027E2BBD5|nr:sulfate ABC transporter permease subunit CysT [Geminocystis sp. GBBB08]MBL1208952.1 sulfate ABC transporter permease subunit CysT [Geminocystis sp. GBBB08]
MIFYFITKLQALIRYQLFLRGLIFLYVGVIIILPLSALFWKLSQQPIQDVFPLITSDVALDAYKLTFGSALLAALINSVFGLILAWILVRYDFPGKQFANGLIDIPLAIPGVVVGITLISLYSPAGSLGQFFEPDSFFGQFLQIFGIEEVNLTSSLIGILLAQIFVTLPFVVRTVQPVLTEFDQEIEEAAMILGATPWQCFWKVIFPQILPALLTGFSLALARGIGEFGVVFLISGNIPNETLMATVYIYQRLEQFDFAGATAVAIVLLIFALILLVCAGILQRWSNRYSDNTLEIS